MSGSVVVAAKIPKRLKELMDRLEVRPGPVIRRALEEEVRRVLLERLRERAVELSGRLEHISDEEIAEIIREDRGR
ncbi:MAG: hypothetical protein QW486_05400 [Candidatus Bathyarchaeia archaeon]|nr:hypothetical protein [Candidatus Bathyarchaeota archaeon]